MCLGLQTIEDHCDASLKINGYCLQDYYGLFSYSFDLL